MTFLLIAIAVIGASGFVGLPFGRRTRIGEFLSVLLCAGGSLAALGETIRLLAVEAHDAVFKAPWPLPGGEFHAELDTLSAWFLAPIFLVSLCGSVYSLGYWPQTEHPLNGRKLRLFYGLLVAGMAIVVLARNAILFLFGWESMALSAFFLVTTEDHDAKVREVGWIYLVATHVATLVLFALFMVMYQATGSFTFSQMIPEGTQAVVGEVGAIKIIPVASATAIFLLALFGFGLKAGIMPLHVWLPGAHAMAPSHVSALMSGVILKMGIYGLVRIASLLHHPPAWWGAVVLALGAVSGVIGIAFALGQRDFKRMLAYSSIENVGIIFLGLGLSLLGRSLGKIDWVILGIAGALLHVWNHAAFKSLLFYSAGSLLHAVHTREMNQLGGLIKKMPRTGFCFLVGAVATCALPPLNGFISELLIYVGFFRTLAGEHSAWDGIAMAAPVLAMVGALAVACFVGAFGLVFLGAGRSDAANHAHESPGTMTAPMFLLVACCLLLGLAPWLVAGPLERAAADWAPDTRFEMGELDRLITLGMSGIGGMQVLIFGIIVIGVVLLRIRLRISVVETTGTWGCGYVAPKPRMQYTPASFHAILVNLFGWALQPRKRLPHIRELFPSQPEFSIEIEDTVLDGAILPASERVAQGLNWFRWLQQGSVQAYLVYILAILMILLFWQ